MVINFLHQIINKLIGSHACVTALRAIKHPMHPWSRVCLLASRCSCVQIQLSDSQGRIPMERSQRRETQDSEAWGREVDGVMRERDGGGSVTQSCRSTSIVFQWILLCVIWIIGTMRSAFVPVYFCNTMMLWYMLLYTLIDFITVSSPPVSWCVVDVLAHYGCRHIIQVDVTHWWWMRRYPPYYVKRVPRKVLYKCNKLLLCYMAILIFHTWYGISIMAVYGLNPKSVLYYKLDCATATCLFCFIIFILDVQIWLSLSSYE